MTVLVRPWQKGLVEARRAAGRAAGAPGVGCQHLFGQPAWLGQTWDGRAWGTATARRLRLVRAGRPWPISRR